MDILVGADPELFLMTNGKFRSAFGLIPGTKKAPHKVEDGAVQVDGMALELNIEPAQTENQFVHRIDKVLATLRGMVPAEYDFAFTPIATFDQDHMDAQPDVAVELGCDPDFNAYTEQQNNPPQADPLKRAAGGHVHVGWCEGADIRDPFHFECCAKMARQLDFFLGLPSLLYDKDVERAKSYGKPGAFRPKPYGMEYRTLSNFWVNDPEYRKFVFRGTKRAFKALVEEQTDLNQQYVNYAHDHIRGHNDRAFKRLADVYLPLYEAVSHLRKG